MNANSLISMLALIFTITAITVSAQAANQYCDSCAGCSTCIQNATDGETVFLNADLTPAANTNCIQFGGADYITFDCAGHFMDGHDSVGDFGFYLITGSNYNTIQHCAYVSDFSYTVLDGGNYTTYYNLTINSTPFYGMTVSSHTNITEVTLNDIGTTVNSDGIIIGTSSINVTIDSCAINDTSGDGIDIQGQGINITNTAISNVNSDYYEGIYLKNAEDCFIWNNNFTGNSGENIGMFDTDETNHYNITRTLATNIVGNAYKGGNYYDDYTGFDFDGDGIGDTAYQIESSGYYDRLPLIDKDFTTVSVTTSEGDQDYNFSDSPGNSTFLDFNFSSTGNVNNTITFTLFDDLSNTSIVTINESNLILDDMEFMTLNLTINSSCPTGSYSGNITWASSNSTDTGNLTIEFSISSYAGNVQFITATWSVSKRFDQTGFVTLNLNNTGDYNLSGCDISLTDALGGITDTYSHNAFTIEAGVPVEVTATLTGGAVGSDTTAHFDVECTATAEGGTDTASVSGTVTITSGDTGGGGGGGGDDDNICGDGICIPPETFVNCPIDCLDPLNTTLAWQFEDAFTTPVFGTHPVTGNPLFSYMHMTIIVIALATAYVSFKRRRQYGPPLAWLVILAAILIIAMIVSSTLGDVPGTFLDSLSQQFEDGINNMIAWV